MQFNNATSIKKQNMTALRLKKNLRVIPQFPRNMKKFLLPLFVVVWLVHDTNTRAITVTTSAAPLIASQLTNISTRGFVQTGDNVMIGGFIVQGTEPKTVIVRAIGPELTQYGVPNALADPTLELHNATGAVIASNDNWQTTVIGGIISSSQVIAIANSGHSPLEPAESAIIAPLPPGHYTAIVRGNNNTTGVALVEVYDLLTDSTSILGNISTRNFVQTGDNVMIGGFIVQGTEPKTVIVRAIGPELTQYGVPNALADPTLDLHNAAGDLIASNDNWQTTVIGGIITSSQVSAIQNSGHALGQASESASIATLPPGRYTAIVRGKNNTTGIALVEVYDLDFGISRFYGSYTGSYSGTLYLSNGQTVPVNSPLAFIVANAAITVTQPGRGSGTVSADGTASFVVPGFGDTLFVGTFLLTNSGSVVASGSWSYNDQTSGTTGSGTWNASHPP
jgi:hypothetical protein